MKVQIRPRGPSGVKLKFVPGIKGDTGDAGPPNVLDIGTVTTGAAGSAAGATITGTSPAQVLNLTIPRGDKGDKGDTGDAGPQSWATPPVAWGAATVYTATAPASVVTYQGETYVCTTSHTSTASFDGTKFTKIAAKGADGTGLTDGDKGDITVSGSGASFSIDANAVTNAKLADMATSTIKGRVAAGLGDPEDLTGAEAAGILPVIRYDAAQSLTTSQKEQSRVNTGGLIQRVAAVPLTTWSITPSTIPADDTIPQISEGAQILSVSITPKSATNRLLIRAEAVIDIDIGSIATIALFQDATANALAARTKSVLTIDTATLQHEMAAGTTSATTFSVRVGANAGSLAINGITTSRIYGGVVACTLIVEEYA